MGLPAPPVFSPSYSSTYTLTGLPAPFAFGIALFNLIQIKVMYQLALVSQKLYPRLIFPAVKVSERCF